MTDEEILSLYFARSEEAIAATDRKYGGYLYTVAYNILHDPQDCEECRNDTYLKTWNSIPPQRPSVLRLFLAKITRNLAIDRYRRQRARGGEFEVTLEELAEVLPAREEDDGALPMLLAGFLEDLPEEERNLFVLRYWHGYSVARLAKAFRMKPNNLSARLYRTREKLRAYLTERGYSI